MSGSPNSDWPEELRLPPIREVDLHPPLSDRGRQALVTFVENSNARILEYRRKLGPKSWATETQLLTQRDLDYLCQAVVTLSYDNGEFRSPVQRSHVTSDSFADVRYLEPIQLVRLLPLEKME